MLDHQEYYNKITLEKEKVHSYNYLENIICFIESELKQNKMFGISFEELESIDTEILKPHIRKLLEYHNVNKILPFAKLEGISKEQKAKLKDFVIQLNFEMHINYDKHPDLYIVPTLYYNHYKDNLYKFLANSIPKGELPLTNRILVAKHHETLEEINVYEEDNIYFNDYGVSLVIYENKTGQWWARESDDFFGTVEKDGEVVPRFKLLVLSKMD